MKIQGMYFNPRNVETVKVIKERSFYDLASDKGVKTEPFDGWEINCVSTTRWYVTRNEETETQINQLAAALDK